MKKNLHRTPGIAIHRHPERSSVSGEAPRRISRFFGPGPALSPEILRRLRQLRMTGDGMVKWRCLAVTALTAFLAFNVPLAHAQSGADYGIEISEKLGRGLLNVISSPLEIPCGIRDDVSEKGARGTVTGFFKGIAFFTRRVLVGVTEVGTFMIPMEATLPAVCSKRPAAAVTN